MYFNNFTEKTIQLNNKEERDRIECFLSGHSLRLEAGIEYCVAILDGEEIIASGSFERNVLKCIAVDLRYSGMGIAGKVVSRLVTEEFNRGRDHLFIYTKPENAEKFRELGFYEISRVPAKVVLLENRPDGIAAYIKQLKNCTIQGNEAAGIVVNCNPFTNGHRYLIEKAAAECDVLHIFVVWEDRSVFPAEIRYRLVKEGTKHLGNVVVHKGRDYIISNATFPTYFMKCPDEAVKTQCLLDIKIFAQYIAPVLSIKRRYVGQEPFCQVTAAYNQTMKEILPGYGMEVVELPRMCLNGMAVSASEVRRQLEMGNMRAVKEMVPETTYDFLVSGDALEIIDKIRK